MNTPVNTPPRVAPRLDTPVGHIDGRPVIIDQQIARYLDEILIERIALAGAPISTVVPFAGAIEPTGWLFCNGQSVSKKTFADLYAQIGGIYGEGPDTFQVPNYTDKLMIGAGAVAALGQEIGASEVTLTQNNIPAYDLTVTDPGHLHAINDPGHDHVVTDPGHSHVTTDPGHLHAVTDPGHTHVVTDPGHDHTAAEASGSSQSGSGATAASSGSTGQASTGVSIDNATTGITVDTNTTGITVDTNTTGVTVDTNTTGVTVLEATTGVTVSSAGGGQAFSILPPSAGVNFIIKT